MYHSIICARASNTASDLPIPRGPPVPELRSRKPKTRRGKRNSKKSCTVNSINSISTWTIFHSNIRGYNSKKESMNNILSVINPNVVTLNEVGLRGNNKCSIQGFNTFTRNRKNQIWEEFQLRLEEMKHSIA